MILLFDRDERLLGIEILGASRVLPVELLRNSDAVTELPPGALQVLRLGLDDWVPMRAVFDLVGRETPDDPRGALLRTTQALLAGGWAQLGDLASGPFQQWDGSASEQLLRLQREWKRDGDDVWFGVWLQNTATGNLLASRHGPDRPVADPAGRALRICRKRSLNR